jgi:hypothetical protein
MANKALEGLKYNEVFTALGRFVEEKELRDVFVMEFEEGIIVTGAVTLETPRGIDYDHTVETYVLSAQDLRALLANQGKLEKRKFFGR